MNGWPDTGYPQGAPGITQAERSWPGAIRRRRPIAGGWPRNDHVVRIAGVEPYFDWQFSKCRDVIDTVSGRNVTTTTRTTTETYFDETGTLRTAAIGAPIIGWDPSVADLSVRGLQCWPQRTNLIRNSTMQGAVVGVPGTLPTNWVETLGGLTREVVAIGTENGLVYSDIRFYGTTTGTSFQLAFGINTEATVTASTGYSGSVFITLVAGSIANITQTRLVVSERTAAGTFLISTSSVFTATNTILRTARRIVTLTTGASTERASLAFIADCTIGVAIDITLRIAAPQLEANGSLPAGPFIPTTNATVTKGATITTVPLRSDHPIRQQCAYSVFSSFSTANLGSSGDRYVFAIGVSTAEATEARISSSGQVQAVVTTASPLGSAASTVTPSSLTSTAAAYTFAPNYVRHSVGVLEGIVDTACYTGMIQDSPVLSIGGRVGSSQFGGWIQRLTILPPIKSPQKLREMSSVPPTA